MATEQHQAPSVELQKEQLIMVHGEHLSIAEAEQRGLIRTTVQEFSGKVTFEKLSSGV